MRNLSNRNKLYTVLGALGAIIFAIGMVIGYMIGSFNNVHSNGGKAGESAGKETGNTATVNKPSVVVSDDIDSKVVNVYFPERKRILGQIPVNSYNTANFYLDDDGFMAYHDDNGKKISHLGVDLSYHQENVDWDAVKDSGIEFVMLRCGYRGYSEGALIEDEKFREYAQACNDRDIALGIYFFTQAVSVEEAISEAEFTLDLIKDYKISYPVAIDTEYIPDKTARTNTIEIEEKLRSDMCAAFCDRIQKAGYYPMIYASENWIRRDLEYESLQAYDFWAAQYLEENDFLYDFTIWQYTDKGYIKGVDEVVDLDISMVDYASFVPALREAVLTGGTIHGATYSNVSSNGISIDVQTGNGGSDEQE